MCSSIQRNKKENTIQGYKLLQKRFIKEVDAFCYFLEHIRSGAKVFKIAADDPNKTFCITFKTLPESDNGAPHILEHSVLNGSRNFPVKSPFDILIKGSLSTFLNAFTSKDFTMFPVASMNRKDYFNLMHVYLDAVFNPLFIKDKRILKQEGWHYELADKSAPVVINGVVYNEMKGSFSSPYRELAYQAFKHLFPGHVYGYESGGYPAAIPSLRQDQFIRFYERYYHPQNSYIFLYGDAEMKDELAFIDQKYLSGYRKYNKEPEIKDQKPFGKMKEVKGFYPVLEIEPVKEKTFLSLNFIAGYGYDRELTITLDLLCEVLVNQESAPVRIALQKAGIGKDVSASTENLKQNVIRIVVQDANASDKDRFVSVFRKTLQEVIKKGLDRKEVLGVLTRMEFQLREGNDAQKGLTSIFQSQPGFFFSGDPFMGLEYEKSIGCLKKAIQKGSLEKSIQKYFLRNRQGLLLILEPKPGLEKKRNDQIEKELKKYKTKLNPAEVSSLIRETKALIHYQKQKDKPAALASIPLLELKDIDPVAPWYGVEEKMIEGIPVLSFEQFNNKVVYINLFFDLRVLPKKMIPYAALLSNLLGLMDTDKFSYGKLNRQLNINTGGFFTSLNSFLEKHNDDKLIPKFQVTAKALNTRIHKLFDLAGEILKATEFTDMQRIKTLLVRHQSQLEASIKERGNRYASIRLSSYFNNQGMFNELSNGLSYYWFVDDLVRNFDKHKNAITDNLINLTNLLFTRENMIASVNCSEPDMNAVFEELPRLLKQIPSGTQRLRRWKFPLEKKNEGIQTSSKVQYISEGYNFKKLGYQWNGKMRVLDKILSTDWLQKRIRVIGGAYGGYSSISPGGFLSFNSYRDPNLKETLENYRKTVDYLRRFKTDSKSMMRYIIGTISSMDHPLTNSQKGEMAVSMYFSKRTKQDLQRDRDLVLSTKPSDIRQFAPMIKKILKQQAFCVYGNAEKISSEKKLFGNLIQVERKQ